MPERVPEGSEPLPSQRPPSPEMKLSPSETIAVVGDPGLASAHPPAAATIAIAASPTAAILIASLPVPAGPDRRRRASKAVRAGAVKAPRATFDELRGIV
ncbi:MAG: hypothetical protein U0R26_02185 [Solirubrobacterales bacterium]